MADVTAWINFEDIILNEIKQTHKKDKYSVKSFKHVN